MAVESVKSVQASTYQTPQVSVSDSVPTTGTKDVEVAQVKNVTDNSTESSTSKNEQAVMEKEPSDATIKQAIKDINKKMTNTTAEFGYHEGTRRVTIKIKDKETDKVVKEIPAEKTLDMIVKAWELAGILVDEKR